MNLRDLTREELEAHLVAAHNDTWGEDEELREAIAHESLRRLEECEAKLRKAERPEVVACKCGTGLSPRIHSVGAGDGWMIECAGASCFRDTDAFSTIPLAVAAWRETNDASV